MPAVKTRIPTQIIRNVIEENRRWQKQTSDNFQQLNSHWFPLSQSFTHGVVTEVANPWYPVIPTGFHPISATNSSGSPIATPTSWTFNPVQRAGFVGLTFNFTDSMVDSQHTLPYYRAEGITSVATATLTTTTGYAASQTRGNIISEAAGVFTVSEAGTYVVHAYSNLGISLTRALLLLTGSTGGEFSRNEMPGGYTTSAALGLRAVASGAVTLPAGGNTRAQVLFNSVTTPQSINTTIEIARLYNDTVYTTPTTIVKGYLIGP